MEVALYLISWLSVSGNDTLALFSNLLKHVIIKKISLRSLLFFISDIQCINMIYDERNRCMEVF